MRAVKNETVEQGYGYKIYKSGKLYFLDTYHGAAYGFSSLAGARESAYYQGFRETKN